MIRIVAVCGQEIFITNSTLKTNIVQGFSWQIFTNDVSPIITFCVMPADSVVELVVQQRHASFLTKAISL